MGWGGGTFWSLSLWLHWGDIPTYYIMPYVVKQSEIIPYYTSCYKLVTLYFFTSAPVIKGDIATHYTRCCKSYTCRHCCPLHCFCSRRNLWALEFISSPSPRLCAHVLKLTRKKLQKAGIYLTMHIRDTMYVGKSRVILNFLHHQAAKIIKPHYIL